MVSLRQIELGENVYSRKWWAEEDDKTKQVYCSSIHFLKYLSC